VISRQTVPVNEGDEINPRKIRLGMMMIGAVTVLSLVLTLAIGDPTARIVFAFVFIAGLIQTWRLRRRGRYSSK
jgi:membrane protease YdiL (CAAX protease family)